MLASPLETTTQKHLPLIFVVIKLTSQSRAMGVFVMKYLIMTDIEGVAGVNRFSQSYGEEPFNEPAKRRLTEETNAAVAGVLDAEPGADVHVFDGHGSGGLVPEALHKRATYRRGAQDWSALYTSDFPSYEAYLYVGQHAMACMPNAPLCHTGSSKAIVYKRLNGVFVGEFGFLAAVAGSFGVPTIFLSGDDKATFEARSLIPNIYTVTTKWGEGWQQARDLEAREACRQIRTGVAEACRHREEIKPLQVQPPYSYEKRYINPTTFRSSLEGISVDILDSRTVLYRSDSLQSLMPVY